MAPPEAGSAEAPRDFAAELTEAEARLAEAERYLGLDRLTARRAELEAEAARPDLWDDADNARAVTTELGRVTADQEQLTGLRDALDEANALEELVGEARSDGVAPFRTGEGAGRIGRLLAVASLRP
jgi:peptide chain release factor 2